MVILIMKMEGLGALLLSELGLGAAPSVVLTMGLRDLDRNGFDGSAAIHLGSVWANGVAGHMTDS